MSSGKAQADEVAPLPGRAPETERRLAVGGAAIPAAAPEHPARAHRRIDGAPLPRVAVHVAQSQLVRGIRPDPRWALQVLPLRRLATREVAVEVPKTREIERAVG